MIENEQDDFIHFPSKFDFIQKWRMIISYSPPKEKVEGQLVYADGIRWNPGSGKGVYVFNGNAWEKV